MTIVVLALDGYSMLSRVVRWWLAVLRNALCFLTLVMLQLVTLKCKVIISCNTKTAQVSEVVFDAL